MTEDPSDDASDRPHGDAIVDRRTDYEKLVELLALGEGTRLDFKRELDLNSRPAQLNFAKDVVAMSNTPPGGYILIGVEDDGQPCIPIGSLERDRFDPARLGDAVRRFVDGRIELLVAFHDHKGCEILLIYVAPHRDGLPVPMNQTGNHPDPRNSKKQIVVFREGEVPVREGAANVPLRHSHWSLILSVFEQQIRSQATETAQAMLREFLNERSLSRSESPTGSVEIPLLLDMEEPAFATAAQTLLESGERGTVRLRRFLRDLAKSLRSQTHHDRFLISLDKWAIFCTQALYAGRPELVESAVAALHEQYSALGTGDDNSQRRVDIVFRIYAVGSMAIRSRAWPAVRSLALQPVPSNPFDRNYVYSSWIRHGQVDGSRSNLIPEDRGGFLISAARNLLVEHPAMRPDVDDEEIVEPVEGRIAADDMLLNSLCEFDLAYCIVVAAQGEHNGGYYPSSVALKDERSRPIGDRIVTDADARDALLPRITDEQLADALRDVYAYAERESARYGMYWDTPYLVRSFLQERQK